MIQIALAEPLCTENIGLKDIARSRRRELIFRGELIMYYSSQIFTCLNGLVIYPMSGNNATLKVDFTDPKKRSFVRSFLYTGSEMIHLP